MLGELVRPRTHGLEREHWVLLATRGGEDVVRAEAFDRIALDSKRLWGR